MTRRIVIAGASGFMGTRFTDLFRADGDEVVTIGRRAGAGHADVAWGDEAGIASLVDGSHLVLGLAGKSVNCRYNAKNKAEIFRSRLETTAALGRAIQSVPAPPSVWMNASTATIYRDARDRPMTEAEGEIGEGFSVDVATSWERALFDHPRDGVRQVALRTAITLGDGSALTPLVGLTRLGLGGPQRGRYHGVGTGDGDQHFSWAHLDDVFRAIRFLEVTPLDGVVNVTSPNPVTNAELMATLRRVLQVPFGMPLQQWMLQLGAIGMRTETELILKSRWVLPARLLEAGFVFEFPDLEGALRDILHRPDGSAPPEG